MTRRLVVVSLCVWFLATAGIARADDAAAREAFARGEKLLSESKPEDAARAFASAAAFAKDRGLADRAELNRAVATLRAGDTDSAAALLGALERAPSTGDARVRASTQYHLGLIEHARAVAMISPTAASSDSGPTGTQSVSPTVSQQSSSQGPTDATQNSSAPGASYDEIIATLRRAERRFRVAAELDPSMRDAARNVEFTQLLIAALEEEQQKQEQQQQSKDQEKRQQDQNEQQQGQQGEQNESDQQESEQGKADQKQGKSGKDQGARRDGSRDANEAQSADQSQQKGTQDKKSGDKSKQQQDAQRAEQQNDNGEKSNDKDQKAAEMKSGAQRDKGQDGQAQREAEERGEGREPRPVRAVRQFDPKAAQILDKEQREKAALARLLRQLSGQPAQVEKDW